ncbi:MAG TPA: DUF4012 domain-containing protein, partial [Baekduia sp.]|nr:DUF4012 domain-containing protein [Baekduia sp.]
TLVVLALLAAFDVYRVARAVHDGTSATDALLRADRKLLELRLDEARRDLVEARRGFASARDRVDAPGPLLLLARITPLVRKQVEGTEAFAGTGEALAASGVHLADTGRKVLLSTRDRRVAPGAMTSRQELRRRLRPDVDAVERATEELAELDGTRLLGPIGAAREDLVRHLPRARERLRDSQDGLTALAGFLGQFGARRYLFFSQNPAEPRPTGGYMGTYGVIRASRGRLSIERYEGTDKWYARHPEAAIAPERAPAPFPFLSPPKPQSLANLNAVPDWPRVARAAMAMWRRGGESPVDGVLSVSTGFLARVLRVIGPARVPGYGDVVTADNVVARMDYYTERRDRRHKEFVAAVARAVLQRVVSTPASRMPQLALAVGQAFDAREAMAWTTDRGVNAALADRGWDGALRPVSGDFFFDAPFSFAAKNGRGLRRTYDHRVDLAADGSARVRTKVTIENTDPPGLLNLDGLGFVTLYGPRGARLDPSASDEPATLQPPVAGHPAAGWFRAAPPKGRTTLRVGWRVPSLLRRGADGRWVYALRWRRVPDHGGDVVRLRVVLPGGWQWDGPAPPGRIPLDDDIDRSWVARPAA